MMLIWIFLCALVTGIGTYSAKNLLTPKTNHTEADGIYCEEHWRDQRV